MIARNRPNLLIGGLSDLDEPLLELHAAREIGPFWTAARRLLESALPIHFTCLYLRPSSLTPSAIFRDGAPFRNQAEFQRFQELNPMPSFFDAHPQAVALRLSDILPETELVRSEFYRKHLALEDDRFLACLCFRQQQTVQALIGLHRARQHTDFSEIEMQLLEVIYPHLDTALERVLAWHRERTERLLLRALVSQLPLATVLLDWDLSILFCNESAREMAAIWNLGPRRARSISSHECFDLPDVVCKKCQTLKSQWMPCLSPSAAGPSSHEATESCRHVPELQVTVRLVDPTRGSLSMPAFMVTFEDNRQFADLDTRAATALFALGRLSHREQEVAQLVCAGHSNKEVAAVLGKSVLTVKKQLHSIYRKLQVSSRTKLVNLLRH